MKNGGLLYSLLMACLLFTGFSTTLMAGDRDNDLTKLKISGASFGNWWIIDSTVKFKAETLLPDGISDVMGEVCDSTGKKVDAKTVSADEFNALGWTWEPKVPGLYTVKFTVGDKHGGKCILRQAIPYSFYNSSGKLKEIKVFQFETQNLAVLPGVTRKPADIPEQSGVSLGFFGSDSKVRWDNILKACHLIGFNSIRMNTFYWSRIEISPGKYDWTNADYYVQTSKASGYNLIGSLFGTPKWAQDKPDPGFHIIDNYLGYMPKDTKYWTDFLVAVINHYPFIKTWEIWNEPHLPGQSVFWHSSPEDYVTLLKTGYETIKKEQPDSTVWLGGVGMRYLPFYEKIIKDGAGKYFDVLPLHGHWYSPEPFMRINRQYGVDQKRVVGGEWHGTLLVSSDNSFPTEENLCCDMLFDFMNQIRFGAEKIFHHSIVGMKNPPEVLDYAKKIGLPHYESNGFFFANDPYRQPQLIEPRLTGVVFHNFIDCFSGKISYCDGYSFANGEQRAALMDSASGKVIFFWQNNKSSRKIAPELINAISASSELIDWEGRKIKADPDFELRPGVIYFLKRPDMAVVARWTNKAQVLQKEAPVLDASVNGRYRAGHIFGKDMELIDRDKLIWHNAANYIALDKKIQAENFAARYAAAFSEDGLDLLVEVKDSKHHQPFNNSGPLWNGDSVQIAIDAVGKGLVEDRLEFTAAMTSNGPLLWKEKAPSLFGALPSRFSPEGNQVKFGEIRVDKTSSGLVYKIHISRDDLYPFSMLNNQPVRFSLLVNNNDGDGRAGYIEWASGIGKFKDPAVYGTLTVAIGNQQILSQASLNKSWGSAKLQIKESSLIVTSSAAKNKSAANAETEKVAIVAGARYKITFNARGNVYLYGMLTLYSGKQKKGQRVDFMQKMLLNENWQSVEAEVSTPPGSENAVVSIYCWQQDGWFEIKDFSMTPAQ